MPAIPERIRSTQTADGGVVLDINKGRMFSLNSSGSIIFQLLKDGLPEDKIVEELVQRFGISAVLARKDLDEFRESLAKLALLTGNEALAME
jgi:Coenzyme PQQ synthesis protein D (PqqD)